MVINIRYKEGGWFQFLGLIFGLIAFFGGGILFLVLGVAQHTPPQIFFGVVLLIAGIFLIVLVRRMKRRGGVDYLRPWKN
jgi:uncharacterized membrane protein HdeD (DUF308 family)